jgi:LuxR family transcriptional regulator, maltose regulon positive regulatory protein
MNDSETLALVDTAPLCEETVSIGRLLHRDTREILLVPSSEVADQRARALAAKLSLPHQGFILTRPRLRKALEPLRDGGVVTLVAGPGCGKTAFIVDVLRSTEGRTVYFSLDEGDRDPQRFLSYLMAGLAAEGLRPPVGERQDWSTGTGDESAVMEATAELMETISAGTRPTLLAIDDFHLVGASPQVVKAVGLIARGLPPGWTLLLSSRQPVPLDLEAVALGGRLVTLDARDLRLTPREVTAWAAEKWALALDKPEATALWRLSEGWPAAFVLLGQQLLSHGQASRADLVAMMARGRDLRTYLERHILSGLDPLTTQVMLAGALLPRLIFPRDAAYLPGGPGEAEAALEELVARGFLVTRAGRRSYTVHPLVRAYAERQAWGSEDGSPAIARAAAHLEKIGENHRAVSLYLRAGLRDEAARPLRALALSSLSAVVDLADDGWADFLPDAHPLAGGWLLVARARMLQQQAKYSAAQGLYEQAARLLAAAGDDEGLLPVLLGSVFCLFALGRWEESLAVIKRCRSLARTPQQKVEVLVVEGNVLLSLCRWDEAVEDWEKALALTPPGAKDALARRIDLHRARLFDTLGHYRLAIQWAEKAAKRGAGKSLRYAMATNAVASAAAQIGHYDRADRLAGACLELVRSRGYTFVEAPTLANQAMVAQGRWDYRTAVRIIREILTVATAAGDMEGCFWAEEMFGDVSRRNRNPARALEHHRRGLAIVDENRLAAAERVRALTGIGMDLAVQGKPAEAQGALEETVRLSRRWSLKGCLAPSLFYLGWLHALSGREQDAARCLTECMHIAEEHGHVHFLSQEAKVALPVLALADRFGAGALVRREVLPRLPGRWCAWFEELATGKIYPTDVPLGSAPGRGLGPALPPPSAGDQMDAATLRGIEALTDREREVLKMITLGMSNKQIGSKLYISEKTVKTHANHVFRKLGVASRLQATLAFQSYQRARRAGGAGKSRK